MPGGIKPMPPNAMVHDFQERLEYSATLSDEPAWIAFYQRIWPNMIMAIRIDKDSKFQRWGIDRMIYLENGKEFSIDEKKRDKDWGDFLLEEWSACLFDSTINRVIKGMKKGWSLDEEKRCDFIAYSIPSSGKCFLLPFEILRVTCVANLKVWKAKPGKYPKIAQNQGYQTVNVAVPWYVLKAAMWEQMHRKFGSSIPLPIPRQDNPQLSLFEHGSQRIA